MRNARYRRPSLPPVDAIIVSPHANERLAERRGHMDRDAIKAELNAGAALEREHVWSILQRGDGRTDTPERFILTADGQALYVLSLSVPGQHWVLVTYIALTPSQQALALGFAGKGARHG